MGRTTRGTSVLAALTFVILASGCAFTGGTAGPADAPSIAPAPAPAAAPALDYASYEGYWCDSGNANRTVIGPEGMDSAEVSLCTSTTIELTLLHAGAAPAYRLTGSESTITAPLENGVAQFMFDDDRGGVASATITLLPDAGMAVRVEPVEGGDNGAVTMDCLMRKDRYSDSRQAEAPEPQFDFIGVKGVYGHSSDQAAEPYIEVLSVSNDTVRLRIESWDGERVFVKKSVARVVADDRAQLDLDTGQSLVLRWTDPGTIVIKSATGVLPDDLRPITKLRTFWNSKYLHTN